MTDDTTTDETPEPEEQTQVEQQDGEAPVEATKAGREAARYRRKLRDLEGEHDTMKGRVRDLQRQIIESRLPGDVSENAFWKLGPEIEALIDDAGHINPVALEEAIASVKAELGPPPGPRAPQMKSSTGNRVEQKRPFSRAFSPNG